jgi:hypothetical protein
MRGGGCEGRVRRKWSSTAWTSLSGCVWRGNTNQRPSCIGIQTSTIWMVANLAITGAGVSHLAEKTLRLRKSG